MKKDVVCFVEKEVALLNVNVASSIAEQLVVS